MTHAIDKSNSNVTTKHSMAGSLIPEDKASQTISISFSLRQAMHFKKSAAKFFLKGNKNKKPLSIQHAL